MNSHRWSLNWKSNWEKAFGANEKEKECPECRNFFPTEFNFCPMCGRILR